MTERIDVEIETLKICGIQIPSSETINIVFTQLKTPEQRMNFVENSNLIVRFLNVSFNPNIIENSRYARDGLRLMNNYQARAELLGEYFYPAWYSLAVMTWFGKVLGGIKIINRSDLTKRISKHANSFKNTDIYDKIDVGLNFDDLRIFPELEQALETYTKWNYVCWQMSKSSQQMKDLLIQSGDICKEKIKSIDPVVDDYRICRFCQSVYNVNTSSDKWKSCGSVKCKRAYIRASRHKNHPKRGWICDPTAQQPCIGGCGSDRKQLNSNRVCFGCHEPFS
jgi:hypothetical protein